MFALTLVLCYLLSFLFGNLCWSYYVCLLAAYTRACPKRGLTSIPAPSMCILFIFMQMLGDIRKIYCIEVEINAVKCNLLRAIFDLGSKGSFWICLLGIQIAAVVPRFVIKMFIQHCKPSDIQIAREAEKFGNSLELRGQEVEMNPPRR